jgi:hypothetical protein
VHIFSFFLFSCFSKAVDEEDENSESEGDDDEEEEEDDEDEDEYIPDKEEVSPKKRPARQQERRQPARKAPSESPVSDEEMFFRN